MGLGPRIDLRVSQQLVMSQQLQQAIKLLALSNLEIEAVIAEELAKNPLLEARPGEGAPGEGVIVREDREFGEEAADPTGSDELIGSKLGDRGFAGRHGLARGGAGGRQLRRRRRRRRAATRRSTSTGWKAARPGWPSICWRNCRAPAAPSAGWPRRSSMSWKRPAISKRRCG